MTRWIEKVCEWQTTDGVRVCEWQMTDGVRVCEWQTTDGVKVCVIGRVGVSGRD